MKNQRPLVTRFAARGRGWLSPGELPIRLAAFLLVAGVLLLIVGLAWPTPPTGSCGNDATPPPGAPINKVFALFGAGLTGAAAVLVSLFTASRRPRNRQWRWVIVITRCAVAAVGLFASFAYSFRHAVCTDELR